MPRACHWTALLLIASLAPSALADQELPEPARVAEELDTLLQAAWKEAGVGTARASDDAEFLRRLFLDVQGVIPEEALAASFLQQKGKDRRQRLVRAALFGQRYARTQATRWALLLMGREALRREGTEEAPLVTWLGQQLAANTPWDAVVRALLTAEGTPRENGAVSWYLHHQLRPEDLAGNAMQVFQGLSVRCAQCHDHPFDPAVSQRDFWGVAAFFARVRRSEDGVREAQDGQVQLPAPPGQRAELIAPRFPGGEALPVGPGLGRREALARALTAPDNPWFARATVNRVWSWLFGRGFGAPDDLRGGELVLEPVLERLAHDFRRSGYDLRRLHEVILLSQAYQLASAGPGDPAAQRTLFARARLRPLSPEQLWASLARATGLEDHARLDDAQRQTLTESRRAFERTFSGERELEARTVAQALALINGPLGNYLLQPERNPVVAELLGRTPAARLEGVYLRVLARLPEPAERRALLRGGSSQAEAQLLQDLLWALLNSSEFAYNH